MLYLVTWCGSNYAGTQKCSGTLKKKESWVGLVRVLCFESPTALFALCIIYSILCDRMLQIPIGHRKENEMAKVSSRLNRISLQWPIDQFRYIKIQPRTIDFSMRLWGINTEFVGFIPQSLVLRSIV